MINNSIKHVILIALLLSSGILGAQEKKLAIISEDTKISKFLDQVKQDHIKDILENDLNKSLFTLYDWDANESSIRVNNNYKDQERVPSYAIYLKSAVGYRSSPDIKYQVDTTGKTTSANIHFAVGANSNYKVINPYTLEIVNMSHFEFFKDSYTIGLPEFKKEFGGDPARIRKKSENQYQKLVKIIIKGHKEEIDAKIAESIKKMNKRKGDFKAFLKSAVPYCYDIEDQPSFSGKKMKEMDVLAGTNQGLVLGELGDVAVMKEAHGHPYLDLKTVGEIKEISEDKAHIKNVIFGRKSLAKDIKKGMKAYFVNNAPGHLSRIVTEGKVDRIRVAVDKQCIFCDLNQEKLLMESPAIILVERIAPEMTYFTNLIKQEKHLEEDVDDLQGKRIGTEIYLKQDGKVYNAFDVSNNQVVSSIAIDKKFLGMSIGEFLSHKDLYELISELNPDQLTMSLEKIIGEKKGKVKSVLVKNLVGFSPYDKFEFFVEVEEDIDGEILTRSEVIGEGITKDKIDVYLAEIKVKKGGKELKKMMDDGKKVQIRYKQKQ